MLQNPVSSAMRGLLGQSCYNAFLSEGLRCEAITANAEIPTVNRVMVATDRSESADRAVRWAANVAAAYRAELLLLQVLPAADGDDVPEVALSLADEELRRFAEDLAGSRGRARVVVDEDPAQAILDAVEAEQTYVVVVGNLGMSGRKQFLLGNIPNRISHNARCTVIIVNTTPPIRRDGASARSRRTTAEVEGRLLGRAWRIGRVMVRAGARELPRGHSPRIQRRRERQQNASVRRSMSWARRSPSWARFSPRDPTCSLNPSWRN
jgi:ubiquinone biosynthesis protein